MNGLMVKIVNCASAELDSFTDCKSSCGILDQLLQPKFSQVVTHGVVFKFLGYLTLDTVIGFAASCCIHNCTGSYTLTYEVLYNAEYSGKSQNLGRSSWTPKLLDT